MEEEKKVEAVAEQAAAEAAPEAAPQEQNQQPRERRENLKNVLFSSTELAKPLKVAVV